MRFKFMIPTIVLFVLVGVNSLTIAENDARIAVAAENAAEDALISRFAARCPYFLLFNEQGNMIEALPNPYSRESRQVGPRVVELLSDKGIHTIIAGEFGEKMIAALKQKKMAYKLGAGRASDAVRSLQKP
ncbi:MAG: NifB/NifX family molybdenum-iron cluster-binding protein [Syntrophobacteraceae bacterium]